MNTSDVAQRAAHGVASHDQQISAVSNSTYSAGHHVVSTAVIAALLPDASLQPDHWTDTSDMEADACAKHGGIPTLLQKPKHLSVGPVGHRRKPRCCWKCHTKAAGCQPEQFAKEARMTERLRVPDMRRTGSQGSGGTTTHTYCIAAQLMTGGGVCMSHSHCQNKERERERSFCYFLFYFMFLLV